ncbi:amidohydrolase family protein [Streptomyces sp. NPDC051576]|uniref:amidohydrolase family protein n=1 Tax=Streptomyces sp. NPDC051576 TaxID=3155803 RepID=UPI0034323A8E
MTDLLITARQLLFGPRDEPVADAAVLVSGSTGRITAAGPRTEVATQAGPGHQTRDFGDATILPGLIDCHVHLAFDAGADPVGTLRASDDPTLLADMADRARQLLASGVTTVRDLGDRGGLSIRLRDEIVAGEHSGPRIIAAGQPLTSPQGHCWFLGGEVRGSEEIRAAVRRTAEQGADLIKIMVTGGGLTAGGPPIWDCQFTPEELTAAVEEAHQAGLPVAAHAHGTAGIAAAITAGVDTVEHCTWMTRDNEVEIRDDLIAELVARGIHVCPATHPNWRAFAERVGPERAAHLFGPTRRMAEHGVRLIAGTDAGVPRTGFDGLTRSMEFLEHAGLSRNQVIATATVEAARALRIADDTGRLRAGYRADLLVVSGSPLDDLKALQDVRLVMTNGHSVGP